MSCPCRFVTVWYSIPLKPNISAVKCWDDFLIILAVYLPINFVSAKQQFSCDLLNLCTIYRTVTYRQGQFKFCQNCFKTLSFQYICKFIAYYILMSRHLQKWTLLCLVRALKIFLAITSWFEGYLIRFEVFRTASLSDRVWVNRLPYCFFNGLLAHLPGLLIFSFSVVILLVYCFNAV